MFWKKKKKEIIKREDYSKLYKIKINIKSLMLFEQLTGKSYFLFEPEDTTYLLYATLLINNPELMMTYETFLLLLQDEDISKWLINEFITLEQFNKQLAANVVKESDNGEEGKQPTISELAAILIAHGLEPHYVLYDMDIWELQLYLDAVGNKIRGELETERTWAYLSGVLSQADLKKIKSPQDVLKFEWEKDEANKRKEDDFKKKEKAIRALFKMDKEETNDGEK